ncbi:MAG: flavodoxin [Thermofilaceae archaeon]
MTKRVLIAYYSWSGNTRRLAQVIHKFIGGALYEIEPVTPYPSSFGETVAQAREEISRSYKPPLKTRLNTVEPYKVIFVGSPNWCGTIAPPVASFLSMYDFSERVIAPFFTHGRGGLQNMLTAVKELCPRSTMLEPFAVYGENVNSAENRVLEWLKRINIEKHLNDL